MRRWIVHLQLHVYLLHHLLRRGVQDQHVDAADAHRVPVGRRCSKSERDQVYAPHCISRSNGDNDMTLEEEVETQTPSSHLK